MIRIVDIQQLMENQRMYTMLIKCGFIVLFINLTACSYSPTLLKESYNDLASELADELKEPLKPTAQQSAMIDDYTAQLLQWHRRNKLPEYSRNLARLAEMVKQDNIPLAPLQYVLDKMDDIPHFEQATHLTYKMLAVAESLSRTQISQLEQSLNREYQQKLLESSNEAFADETYENIRMMFRFIGINLNPDQLKQVKEKTNNFHDIRPYELQAEKLWNQRIISLLREKNSAHFSSRFSQFWNVQDTKLTGKAIQLEQQNKQRMALLIRELIMTFGAEQKESLSRQLTSMSHMFSEMANN